MTAFPEQAAPTAHTWEELADAVLGCVSCPELVASRTNVVPGVHPPGSRLLLVGEAPGAQEDLAGVPFVGRSGRLLDELLAEAGLDRAAVAVVNVLKCRPPANRAPRAAEARSCRPWLERQVELVDPLVVCTLGTAAAEWALGRGTRIAAARRQPASYRGRPLVVTYHPSAAVRFGPAGVPLAALREDLATAARLVAARLVEAQR